ncbi:esterase-like activity of phytase family protein [Defluviimonas sp. SAOS-178_SWC]|uniref:esterase-like activity of phytase family protein n=1 Tax=Defluviimonas sp. SAOS-178_SWC TaxID=3121287 RepID=UPI0032219A15
MRGVDAAAGLGLLAVLLAGHAGATELIPRGIYEWQEDHEGFGGFSGLAMAGDGASFLAVTDEGEMFRAKVSRDDKGQITNVESDWQARLLDNSGKPVHGFTADAEALSVGPDGSVYVGYESYTRITSVSLPDLMPVTLHRWDRFRDLWGNAGFEGLAILPDGGLIAILETPGDGATFGTYIGRKGDWQPGPPLPAEDGFDAADAVFGPDGKLWLLERRLAATGFATHIRRFAYDGAGFGAPETLLETRAGTLDNMEGMSLWVDPEGRLIVSLISDDNFLFVQKTILAEYEVVE